MWRLALAASAIGMALIGCNTNQAIPQPSPSASASAPAPSADPTAKKSVTKADCTKWADHGTGVVVGGFKEAAAACPPSQRDTIVSKFENDREALHMGALEICTKHLGELYLVKDGA